MPAKLRMAGFTKIMYAITIKVVTPAKTSVLTVAPRVRNANISAPI
jgi:hypothetical protein